MPFGVVKFVFVIYFRTQCTTHIHFVRSNCSTKSQVLWITIRLEFNFIKSYTSRSIHCPKHDAVQSTIASQEDRYKMCCLSSFPIFSMIERRSSFGSDIWFHGVVISTWTWSSMSISRKKKWQITKSFFASIDFNGPLRWQYTHSHSRKARMGRAIYW